MTFHPGFAYAPQLLVPRTNIHGGCCSRTLTKLRQRKPYHSQSYVQTAQTVNSCVQPFDSYATNVKTKVDSSKSASDFKWTDQWYPIAWASDVPSGLLVRFSLFDHPYIVFKDDITGVYVVMSDVCPHRKAPLSDGRLFQHQKTDGTRETLVECTYHGWKFDCKGTCVDIPHAPLDTRIPPTANVSGIYATTVTNFGLIFMWFGNRFEADESKLPVPSTVTDQSQSKHATFFRPLARRVPLESSTIIENLVDPGHVHFSHHGTSEGNRTKVSRNTQLRVVERDPAAGFLDSIITFVGSDIPLMRISMHGGTFVHYSIRTKTGAVRLELLLYAIPSGRYETALFAVRARHNCGFWFRTLRPLVPIWIDHAHNNLILDGDTPLLQWQDVFMREKNKDLQSKGSNGTHRAGKGAWASNYIMSTSTYDALVADYRKWNDVASQTMPFISTATDVTAPGRMRHEEINDRYEWHVKHCVSCSTALRSLRLLRLILAAGAIAAASTLFTTLILTLAMKGVSSKVHQRLLIGLAVSGVVCALMLLLMRWTLRGIQSLTHTNKAHELHQEETLATTLLDSKPKIFPESKVNSNTVLRSKQ